ncbi:PAS domain S-box protein [Methanoculleus sp. Wushi-C6]|uniref:histidine kinase n=1 Tax=Methanoculleus caldifontis TaxID=2651577 RepID=A0ABU3WY43_9EURY|nr:PAS domain S-box protein [Methanoculleus sp. Wushi-C6]MDV2480724.1 PAS domain S-box protein [Methanoculleus sp. Wushi-C6]
MSGSGDVQATDAIRSTLQILREEADPAGCRLIDALADRIDALEERARQAEEERDRLREEGEVEHAMLRATIDRLPAGVIVVDAPSGELVLGNEQASRILEHRYPATGRVQDLFAGIGLHPDGRPYRPDEWPVCRSIAAGERVAGEEIRFVRADGTTGFIEVSSAPIACSGGEPRYGVAVFSDITERKRAQEARLEQEEQLRSLIESSADGILITDEAGRITTWNMGMEAITGLSAGSVSGMPAWEVLSRVVNEEWAGPDNRARYRAIWERLLRDGAYRHLNRLLEVQIQTPQGIRHLQQNVFVTPTRQGFRVGCIVRDITDGRWTDEALRHHAEDLARLNADLEYAQREANLYLDILTHDIGNTENVSNLYADLLVESLQEETEATDYARKLRRSVRRSIEILGMVSKIRRIHFGKAELAPADLDAVIQDEIGRYPAGAVRYRGHASRVLVDEHLAEVLSNLIGNAVKHGGPGVAVTVRTEDAGEFVRVSVEDTGPGVPDGEKEAVFHRYEQQKRGVGEGLGLYLVKILVERYGGKVWVEDRVPGRPEEGAAFRFTLRTAA